MKIVAVLALLIALVQPAAAQAPDAQAATMVQQAGAAAENIFQSISGLLTGVRQKELVIEGAATIPPELQGQFDRLDTEVVAPLIEAGAMSCAAVAPALTVALTVAAKYSQMGIEPRTSVSKAIARLNPSGGKCEEDAKAECTAKANPAILVDFWMKATRGRAITGTMRDDPVYQPLLEKRARRICTPKSYRITGNAGPMRVTGAACSLEEPFTAKGEGGSMEVDFIFNPDSENGGRMSYTGKGTGDAAMVRMSGKGTYTLKVDDKGGTMTHVSTGAVHSPPGGSATHTTTFKLTRMDPC